MPIAARACKTSENGKHNYRPIPKTEETNEYFAGNLTKSVRRTTCVLAVCASCGHVIRCNVPDVA